MRHSPNQTDARRNRPREPTPREKLVSDPELSREVRDHFAELDVPGTPDLRMARLIQTMGIPDWCGARQVHDVRIQKGDPVDGAARSDDHISRFEIEIPWSEINWDDVSGQKIGRENLRRRGYAEVCEECGCDRAMYVYSATHFISGFERVYCPDCETVYAHEEWG